MTAPTTRETADHAELAAELRAFEGSDDLGNGDFTVCEFAADALENLLSEIAALRGEVERVEADRIRTVDDRMTWTRRTLQAERQRDEALDAARKLSAAISWTDYPFIDNNTGREELISRLGFMQKDAEQPRAFLANQGADQ